MVGIFAAFVLACANGANDCANSVGTSVGAGALTLGQAIFYGSCCELIGAVTMGPFVAKTIGAGEINTDHYADVPDLFALMMLAVLIGGGVTTLLATAYGYPISATHGVVSGLVAVAIASGGDDAVKWGELGVTVCGWVASPVVGLVVAFFAYMVVGKTVIYAENPGAASAKYQPVFLTVTIAISFLFIFIKGPEQVQIKPAWLGVLISIGAGAAITAGVTLWKGRSGGAAAEGLAPRFDEVEQPFVPLLVVAGMTVAFAHGGNDVGNSVGPLAVIGSVWRASENGGAADFAAPIPLWELMIGAAGFVVGICLLGSRTIETVGSKITALCPSKSFATQIGAAIAVLASSVFGLPVSTSHCLVGAVIGVSFAQTRLGDPDAEMDLSVLKKIVIGWVVTIPLAAGVAVVAFLPFKAMYKS